MASLQVEELEARLGKPLDQVIPEMLNRLGSQKAVAEELDVSPSFVSLWVTFNGYRRVSRWEKVEATK